MSNANLLQIPNELIHKIALYLPCNSQISNVALAFKSSFTALILYDAGDFAYRHVESQVKASKLQSISEFLKENKTYGSRWLRLPFFYKVAFYGYLHLGQTTITHDLLLNGCKLSESLSLRLHETLSSKKRLHFDSDHSGALYLAIIRNDLETVKFLLELPKCDPSASSNRALILAAKASTRTKGSSIFHVLLNDPRTDPTDQHNTCYLEAATRGNLEIIRLLTSDPRIDPAVHDNSAVINAAVGGHVAVVEFLLSLPNVDPSRQNNSAFYKAVRMKHWDVVRLLLMDKRVDPSTHLDALLTFADENQVELLKRVVCDPRVDVEKYAWMGIEIAARQGHAGVISLLLEFVNDDSVLNHEQAALTEAIRNNHMEAVKALLRDSRIDGSVALQLLLGKDGVDPTADSNYSLRLATENRHDEFVEMLLEDDRVMSSI
ncbi:ankyrin repeat-containing domain protein [Obelidium mucronatum]|nr:ankyrin repeat-containing domain protein [Obelidium mucronatum]